MTFEEFMATGPRDDVEWRELKERQRNYGLRLDTGIDTLSIEDPIAFGMKKERREGSRRVVHYLVNADGQVFRIPFDELHDLLTWIPSHGAPPVQF